MYTHLLTPKPEYRRTGMHPLLYSGSDILKLHSDKAMNTNN